MQMCTIMAWPDGTGASWDSHTKRNSYVGCVCLYVHVEKRNCKAITNAHKDKCLKDGHKKKKRSMILKNKSEGEPL